MMRAVEVIAATGAALALHLWGVSALPERMTPAPRETRIQIALASKDAAAMAAAWDRLPSFQPQIEAPAAPDVPLSPALQTRSDAAPASPARRVTAVAPNPPAESDRPLDLAALLAPERVAAATPEAPMPEAQPAPQDSPRPRMRPDRRPVSQIESTEEATPVPREQIATPEAPDIEPTKSVEFIVEPAAPVGEIMTLDAFLASRNPEPALESVSEPAPLPPAAPPEPEITYNVLPYRPPVSEVIGTVPDAPELVDAPDPPDGASQTGEIVFQTLEAPVIRQVAPVLVRPTPVPSAPSTALPPPDPVPPAVRTAATRNKPVAALPEARAQSPGPDLSSLQAEYGALLKREIERRKRYPRPARRRGDQGRVVVAFSVDTRGNVRGATIIESAGHPALDRAALALLDPDSARFTPPPAALSGTELRFEVPIEYRLD